MRMHEIVAAARVRNGFPWWLSPFLSRDVVAITLGRTIYAARPLSAGEMQHELTHVRQMHERGIVRFLARYAYEYAAGRARGLAHGAAYRNISFEREAFAAEAAGVELAESRT